MKEHTVAAGLKWSNVVLESHMCLINDHYMSISVLARKNQEELAV
jgi:hypothetical protein